MEKDFLELKKQMIEILPVVLRNGLYWKLTYVEPEPEFDNNGYYDYHEYEKKNGKIRTYSGFSSPDYNSFRNTMIDWAKSYYDYYNETKQELG